MECVICEVEGGNVHEGVITLQSTPHGMVCPRCIHQLVGDVIKMRTPWTKQDLEDWDYDKEKNAEYLLDKMVEAELQGEEE